MKKESVLTNFFWRFAERCGAQAVSLIVSLVLARILTPEDYGKVSLVMVFVSIMQVFVDSGLGTALIQKKDADDLDFSSVFYFNFVVCLALYGVMYGVSPAIARFYNDLSLTPIIRALSLTIVISGVKGIQQSYVSRNMLFKRFFYATLGGTIFSAVLGIAMAYAGCGVWAIVAQQLSNTAIDTLILWLTVKWRPKWMFSWSRMKELFSYGWKLLASGLLDRVYDNLRGLIIGKLYSPADLAYYEQGDRFPDIIIANISSSVDSVLLPALSMEQDNVDRVRQMVRRSIQISSYVMAPMMMGLAFCAEPIVRLVLTDKWLPCVPFMRIACTACMFESIHTANLNAIKAMGRSDLFLKLEFAKKIVCLAILLSAMRFGVLAIAYSTLLSCLACQIINSWPNRKLLNYSYLKQLWDILPGILTAVAMGICVKCVELLGLSDFVTLVIQIPLGVILFVTMSAVLRLEAFAYILNVVQPMLKKLRGK